MSWFDKFPWLGWTIVIFVELAALAVGIALWGYDYIPWYVVPLFLIAPPVIAIIVGVFGLVGAEANGENPFQ